MVLYIYGDENMNTNFIVNDYLVIWNLLFQASISEDIYKLKQKIWETYKSEYNSIYKDKEQILKDYKNFIPNDDTIYNIVLGTKDYEKLKKQLDKYRIEIMRIWDKNKKETDHLIKNIVRIKLPKYNMFVVNKELNIIDYPTSDSIIIGKEIDRRNTLKILLDLNKIIITTNIKRYKENYVPFKKAIIELALNEYATRLTNRSFYQVGDPKLSSLKRFLYPYWLMYLGVSKNDLEEYMMRDKIVFDIEKYAYEKELKKMNLETFIDFCIRNQRYIVRERKSKKADIEVL